MEGLVKVVSKGQPNVSKIYKTIVRLQVHLSFTKHLCFCFAMSAKDSGIYINKTW
jgi:hypothetical protein